MSTGTLATVAKKLPNLDQFVLEITEITQQLKAAVGSTCLHSLEEEKPRFEVDRDAVADLMRDGGDSEAAYRYRYCGESGRGWVGVCTDNASHDTIYHPFSCMLRTCPVCAARRSRQLAHELAGPIGEFVAAAPSPYRLRHVVLTTPVSIHDDLEFVRSEVVRLRKGVIQMFKDRWPKDKWLGGFVGVEFGERGRRLHFHVMILCKFIDREGWLTPAWSALVGVDQAVTFVRQVADVWQATLELTKYVTKPVSDGNESQDDVHRLLARAHFVFKGLRRAQTFGSFYETKSTERVQIKRNVEDAEPACCPDCGAKLRWVQELTWLEENGYSFEEWKSNPDLDLIPANKFPRPPPDDQFTQQLLLL